MLDIKGLAGLTSDENEVMRLLAEAWNVYMQLGGVKRHRRFYKPYF